MRGLATLRREVERLTAAAEAARVDLDLEARAQVVPRLADFVRHAWPVVESRPYVHSWHIDVVCEHLEAITHGRMRALIICLPPRHSKSLMTTVFWPAWTWLQEAAPLGGPRTSFGFATWSSMLSLDHNLTLRRLIESPWYRSLAGRSVMIDAKINRSDDFRLRLGGRAFATSIQSMITGFGFDIRITDDPHNLATIDSPTERRAVARWYDEVWKSRIEDPARSAEVIVMQRAHQDDLVGHVLASERREEFELLVLPAQYDPAHPHLSPHDCRKVAGEWLDVARFGDDGYATIAPMTSFARAAQMQQWPQARDMSLFANAQWRHARDWPRDGVFVRYWDKAATGEGEGGDPDYTVGALATFGDDGRFWLVDVKRGRWSPLQIERVIAQTAQADGQDVAVWIEQEPGSSGAGIIDQYRRHVLRGWPVYGDRVTGSKVARAEGLIAAAEAGNVMLVEAPWNREFVAECEAFSGEGVAHDDQVDAAAGAFRVLAARHGRRARSAALRGV